MEGELIESLSSLFERDLNRLGREISEYENEADLWLLKGEITNTPGNLALHICGNLNHFIGNELGYTGYVRNREAEFNDKNIPRAEILEKINAVRDVVVKVIGTLDEADFVDNYPLEVFGKPMTTLNFLMHLQGHLNYHLGQINYHRRLINA